MSLNIPFDAKWNSVAISMSGGADSTLLCYLLCNNITIQKAEHIKIHVISHTRCWKNKPWQQYDSERIYNWMTKKFSNITFERHINFIAPDLEYGNIGPCLTDEYGKNVSGDNIQQRAYAEFICNKHNIDAYYNGVTRNPPVENFNGMIERSIEKNENNGHLEAMQHMGRWAFHPFRFVDKSEIVKTYLELDLIDLFEITRSCEGEFENINYETYVKGQLVPTCRICFWCQEREWAIRANGIVPETQF
jgi:7-cyano-7-deazaguanine synthase in queuosine biosynthesis